MGGNFPTTRRQRQSVNTRRITASLPSTDPLQKGPTRAVGRREILAALLAAALNEEVTVAESGKRQQVTKRKSVIVQLVNE